ncbi:septation inhibitor protein [Bifidobacterium lemurum]|uniref:Cell division protein CrgA n=2 Tax=Bifidobacterium lemurum TaxID=1603886 RepID=A0A261FQL5_9BIFI|nr:septation inhibitor protein [Bifidobacterium lemurum]
MADQELHETDSNEQKDWQSEVQSEAPSEAAATAETDVQADASATAEAETDADATTAEAETDDAKAEDSAEVDIEDLGIDMEQVQAVLNATADKATLTPQMRRMMTRQAENTKRVEESIKGTKSNPRWFVPLFCTLMIIGLIWAVVYYLSPSGSWPIPNIGAWNLAIAFAIIMVGFLMTMWWR